MDQRAMTIRIPADLAEDLEAVARVDEVPVVEEIRRAIIGHIGMRRRDPEFRRRLDASVARNARVLRRIQGGDRREVQREIARYARRYAGTEFDLDADLEQAGLESLTDLE